jgi:hypothetical protein
MTPVSPERPPAAASRDAGPDHLRIILTCLVVFHHVAMTYGGSPGWYWREPNAANPWLFVFNLVNQSYFMGFFFLLAGYYTPTAYDRKGPRQFVFERLLRLGIPLVLYFYVLSPLTVAVARTSRGAPFWSGWWARFQDRAFAPGPLWFAEALLLFSLAYTLWRGLRPSAPRNFSFPSLVTLGCAALLLGVVTFLVRLVVPIGSQFLWLQLGYFPGYIFLFIAGCAASRSRLLAQVDFQRARPWLLVTAVALLTFPQMYFSPPFEGAFEGGWSLNALYFALWEPLMAWGVILGLLWIAQRHWSRATVFTRLLAPNAYGAFIVHPPVAVAFSVWAASWSLPPLAKFALVGSAACAGSFLVASLLRALPGAKRVV